MEVRELVASNLVGYAHTLKESDGNMLDWHDCKTDPPKKNGPYAVLIKTDSGLIDWYKAYWFNWGFAWSDFDKPRQNYNEIEIIKWAKIELPE